MANKIFENLLIEQINIFKESFTNISKDIFSDNSGKLIHPGEFGTYREAICKRFLEFIIPKKLSIDNGFLINSNNEVSTQCDIIIYDSKHTPLIQTNELQRFFPVETVCAIGEVKSTLSKTQLKEALLKLSNVKKLSEFVKNPSIIYNEIEHEYSPTTNCRDQKVTFIICQKLDMNLNEITNMYDNSIESRHKHNIILSIEDGIILYELGSGMHIYPVINNSILQDAQYSKSHSNYEYFKIFSHYLFEATTHTTILYPEFSDYMNYPEK